MLVGAGRFLGLCPALSPTCIKDYVLGFYYYFLIIWRLSSRLLFYNLQINYFYIMLLLHFLFSTYNYLPYRPPFVFIVSGREGN